MRVLSVINDGLLHAENALVEMTIREYLDIGIRILRNNQYQRKRVNRSSSIYSLLNEDLKRLCTIPTIVLAFADDGNGIRPHVGMNSDELELCLRRRNLIILDGLQRTYTLRDVEMDLLFPLEEKERFMNHIIRVEIYSGLSNTGILYRMLTLNTGQTPMSKKHEIEILYSSYIDHEIEGIRFIRQTSNDRREGLDCYNFYDAIDGFNSFLDSDESAINRFEVLTVVQKMEKIVDNDYQQDLFRKFIKLYNTFVHRVDELSGQWSIREEKRRELNSVYGKDVQEIFSKAQTISAFGAAVGKVLWDGTDRGFNNIEDRILGIQMGGEADDVFMSLLRVLADVRERAKKIGVAQRLLLKLLFIRLFDVNSDSYMNFSHSIDNAFNQYNNGNDIRPRQESLFD